MSKFDLKMRWRSAPTPTRVILTGDPFYKELEVMEALRLLPDMECLTVYGDDTPPSDLFSNRRLIVWRDIDLLDKKKGEALMKIINEDNRPDLYIFVTSDKDKSPAFFKTLKHDHKIEYEAVKAWEMSSWLVWAAKRRGLVLQETHAEVLILNLGEDKTLLDLDLKKMKVFKEASAAGPNISIEELQKVFVAHQVMKPFVMLEAWGLKDHAMCVRIAEKIFSTVSASEDPVFGWIALFVKHIEALIQARSMLDNGASETALTSLMGWSKPQSEKMLNQIRVQNTKQLVMSYHKLIEMQRMIIFEADRFQKFILWILYTERVDL